MNKNTGDTHYKNKKQKTLEINTMKLLYENFAEAYTLCLPTHYTPTRYIPYTLYTITIQNFSGF